MGVALQDSRVRGAAGETRRAAGDTGLPWTVVVINTDIDAELTRLNGRRRLWLAGLAALAALILTGTVVAARAVSRELAAARLQADFVSAVSHEFRTPLTSLRQLSENLRDARVATEERRQHAYGALVRQTNRLQRLVESLLDFGRMQAGTAPHHPRPEAIDRLVASVVAEFTEEAGARGQRVDVHVTPMPVVAPVDRDSFANALWNLLDNAIKYSPGRREAWVEIRLTGGGVAVSVRDRGMGIPREEQQDIFRRFARGARAKTAGIRGTGIGLSVVQHVVAAHAGHVRVESEPEAGSTFTIWLPHASAAAEADACRAS